MAIESVLAKGREAYRVGRTGDAERFALEGLAVDPDHPGALLLVGQVRAQMGRLDEARDALERAFVFAPESFEAAYHLAIVHGRLGLFDEATAVARRAIALNPVEATIHHHLGQCLLGQHKLSEAEECFRTALRLEPGRAPFYFGLGLALRRQGRAREAVQAYRRASELDPASHDVLIHLALELVSEGNATAAEVFAREAVDLEPASLDAHFALGNALFAANRVVEADEHLRETLRLHQPDAKLLVLYGQVKVALGQIDEGRAEFNRALELDGTAGAAYLGIARIHRFREEDLPFVGQMEAAPSGEAGSLENQGDLRYALGKACEDLGRYQEAMGHFEEANRCVRLAKFGDRPFNRAQRRASHDFGIRLLSVDLVERHRGAGSPSEIPIFVVGMMRSGTTLTEQILSSHPLVGGAGELNYWHVKRGEAFDRDSGDLSPATLRRLADEYVEIVKRAAPGMARVVDKMPSNYDTLPLIHLALPNARIIHVRRHPVDTCISIFSTPKSNPIMWTHDKGDIVFMYREYLRLMEAWRTAIPADRLLEIDYESLVAEPEGVTRQLIAFCGLEWDDACLRPERAERGVLTPSAWQVRQPIYRTSSGRWRRYEPWLGPFRGLLAG